VVISPGGGSDERRGCRWRRPTSDGWLRCPSETLSLRWPDIDWEREKVKITSPKTEHHPGRGSRATPLFPELGPYLEEAFEAADDGAEYIVMRYRHLVRKASDGWHNAQWAHNSGGSSHEPDSSPGRSFGTTCERPARRNWPQIIPFTWSPHGRVILPT
jgi:hypothetical protein